jgi:hypothetical protein
VLLLGGSLASSPSPKFAEVGGDGKGEHAPEGGVGWFCTGSAPIGVSAMVSRTPPPAPLRGDELTF